MLSRHHPGRIRIAFDDHRLVLQRRFIRRGDFREQFEPDKVLP